MSEMSKLGLVLGTALVLAVSVWAQDESKTDNKGDDPMAAAMAELMKYATPGEHHKNIASLEGRWKMNSKFRMAPEAPWDESTGDSSIEWVLGGRFLQQKVKSPPSESMPVPFEGLGLLGYDNLGGKYINLWMDNFMTGVMIFTGSCDASGKNITVRGEFANPLKGGALMKSRWVYHIINNDKFVFEMWEPDDNGNEYMHGEITYIRVR